MNNRPSQPKDGFLLNKIFISKKHFIIYNRQAMNEIIEIKRKEFEVVQKLGEHSYKVQRKDKFFFLKKYNNKEDFRKFVDQQHRLKITAIDIPKVYLFDKNQMISVVEFIEGETMLEYLSKQSLENEDIIKRLFLDEWYMRREKLRIDFLPEHYIYNGKKLVYLPYTFGNIEPGYNFTMKDLKLWFDTKELKEYLESKGYNPDAKRFSNEYLTNKQMALMTVKYYI